MNVCYTNNDLYRLHHGQPGYVALTAVMVLLAVISILTVSLSYLSIDTGLLSQAARSGSQAVFIAESCVNEALLQLNKTATLPTSITLPEGSCSITTHSQSSTTWDFSATVTSGESNEEVRVTAERGSTVTLTSWQRVAQ